MADRAGVFIAHGHDEANALKLKEMLEKRWGIDAWFLVEKGFKGRTLIEKFEEEAEGAKFAFVLLTPDDLVVTADKEYSQPRPNPIFELGWLYRHLGRARVCILLKENAELPTDLDGVGRVCFRESIAEKIEDIERELQPFFEEPAQSEKVQASEAKEQDEAIAELREILSKFEALWKYGYQKNQDKLIGDQISKFRYELASVGDRLIELLGRLRTLDEEQKEEIAAVASDIQELANWQFFLDGGKSVRAFDITGDTVLEKVSTLLAAL